MVSVLEYFVLVLQCDDALVVIVLPPPPGNFIAARPKAALLCWFFGDFRKNCCPSQGGTSVLVLW